MRRLLIVGLEVPNFPSISWSEWPSANPLDYQGLVLDCRKLTELPHHSSINQTLLTLVNNNHTAYLILPEAADLDALKGVVLWIPNFNLYLSAGSGQTLNVKSNDPLFENYKSVLAGHEMYFQLQSTNQPWVSGIVDNVSRTICAKVQTIYLLHPPSRKFAQKALKIIIEHFKPDPFPISSVSKPGWVDQAASTIPGVAEIQALRTSIKQDIDRKNEQLQLEEEKLGKLSSWADLLWLEGLSLQTKVSEALNLLGMVPGASDPSGHNCDLTVDESGVHFVFEVTGSTGTIGIEKGRQLMQWVTDAPDPASAKGVLVGSAFRNDPPDRRPPSPDRKIFVLELERFAAKYHLALLDIRELYRVVRLKLSGQPVDKSLILNGLSGDGVVKFQI